jgi:hypothetical protein
MATAALIHQPGEIEPGTLYTLNELMSRANLGKSGIRTLRREGGLKIRYVGGRGFCLGSDFISAVVENGKDSK